MVSLSSTVAATTDAAHTYDVFNGDADGICALHQLRLAFPKEATLVTGVKRDVELLQRIPGNTGLDVTVLDVSLDVNVTDLKRLLDSGAQVQYFDHHSAQYAFPHPNLHLYWDDSPDVCTSILVDRYLQGRFRQWAAVAAFGDNLPQVGRLLARQLGMSDRDTHSLEQLGQVLNYNAYGEQIDDLHVAPDRLYETLHQFAEPLDFIVEAPEYRLLVDSYRSDTAQMGSVTAHWQCTHGAIYILPCERWARRVSGIFANAHTHAGHSCAVLIEKTDGSYLVSVRSGEPDDRPAHGLCGGFDSGGGRRLAAGINCLPSYRLGEFVQRFSAYFTKSDSGIWKDGAHAG